MFSTSEKKQIADKIEKLLLKLNHPEMPKTKPEFSLHIDGKESWNWADIKPNWTFIEDNIPGVNQFNEDSRDLHNKNKI